MSAPHAAARARLLAEDAARVVAACALELPALAGRNLLLTGATGFIGGSIVDALLAFNASQAQPCRMFLPTRSIERATMLRPDLRGPGATWVEWRHEHPVRGIDAQIDYVIHAGGAVDPAAIARDPLRSAAETLRLTERVVEVARSHQATALLYLSSGAVYGEQPAGMAALPEDFTAALPVTGAASSYGQTKRDCEWLVRQSGLPAVAARLFACLGPRQAADAGFAVPDFFRQAREQGRIVLNGDGRALRTFAYISDVVTVLFKLLLRPAPGMRACNVGAIGPVVSMAELAGLVAQAVGGAEVSTGGGTPDPVRRVYVPDVGRMLEFHRPQVGLEQALLRMAAALPPPDQRKLARVDA